MNPQRFLAFSKKSSNFFPADSPDRSPGMSGSTSAFLQQQQRQQAQLLQHQDRQLGVMSESVGNLRNVSATIGRELDEQAVRHRGQFNENNSVLLGSHKHQTPIFKMPNYDA